MTPLEEFLFTKQKEAKAYRDEAQEGYEFWKTQYARHSDGQRISASAERRYFAWLGIQPRNSKD